MTRKHFMAAAGILAAGLATGCSAIAGDTSSNDPVRCEIVAENRGNMVQLSGLMHADTEMDGSYRFIVKSAGAGGNTNISQGSRFHAGPNGPTMLGMVMLSAGGAYDVTLDVEAGGERFSCEERLGGRI